MAIRKIYRVLDADTFCDKKGNAIPGITFEKPFRGVTVLSDDGRDSSLEELVFLCDQHAESINAHEFCGAHRLVAALSFRMWGREQATKFMLQVALRGGINGMAGIYEKGDSYKELGVGRQGYDWDGTFGD